MSTKRSINQGLPKDSDDHGSKRQKTTTTAKAGNPKTVVLPNSSPLDSADIASKVFPFLEARELLNFVSCRRDYSHWEYLTYPLVLRSILLTGGKTKQMVDMNLNFLKSKKIATPDPFGILRVACGKMTFGQTIGKNLRERMVYATGEVSPDYNHQNRKAILQAYQENMDDSKERERWKQTKTDGILQQLADLLGDHPSRKDILTRRRWDLGWYNFRNEFVDNTLQCVLDLKNYPGSITKEQLLEATRVLKKYYGEHQRQGRILTRLDNLRFQHMGRDIRRTEEEYKRGHRRIYLSTMGSWRHTKKRFVFVQKETNDVLIEFLKNNRDKDPNVIAEEIYETIQNSQIYTNGPLPRSQSRWGNLRLYS